MVEESESLENEEMTLSAEVDSLLEKGYSRRQLLNSGYSGSLIRQRLRKKAKRDGLPPPEANGDTKDNDKQGVALTIKEKEQVLPEWLETQVAELFDGSIETRKVFMAGMSIPLLGMRLFSESIKPLGSLMAAWQQGQTQAARDAQQSGSEIARETVNQFLPQILQTVEESARAQAPNPMAGMVSRLVEPMFQNMFSSMFGMNAQTNQGQQQGQQSAGLPQGWSDESQQ